MTGEQAEDEDAPPAPGMLRTTPEAAAAAERAAAQAPAGEEPAVTPDKLKALKDKARAEIEQRLKDRRKKRRLLRGGDISGGFSVS